MREQGFVDFVRVPEACTRRDTVGWLLCLGALVEQALPARGGRRRARVPRVGPRTVRGGRRRARARAPGRRGARGRDAEPGLAPAGDGW
jgi:hypothetical protein